MCKKEKVGTAAGAQQNVTHWDRATLGELCAVGNVCVWRSTSSNTNYMSVKGTRAVTSCCCVDAAQKMCVFIFRISLH